MQALFHGIAAVVIAIIAIAAYRLALGTNDRHLVLWAVFGVLLLATAGTQTELAALFHPGRLGGAVGAGVACAAGPGGHRAIKAYLLRPEGGTGGQNVPYTCYCLHQGRSFVFGSGFAIVPFPQQGVAHDLGWPNKQQFLDAVAVALITLGPIVITGRSSATWSPGWRGPRRSASSCPCIC